ncbi:hypothetical protein ACIQXI_10910 [Lysinibacillus sp. NPDC097195]
MYYSQSYISIAGGLGETIFNNGRFPEQGSAPVCIKGPDCGVTKGTD